MLVKIIGFFIATVFLFASEMSFAAKLTACHSCDGISREHAAKQVFNWDQSGTVYVMDLTGRAGYKYNVTIDYIQEGTDRFPIHKATQMALTSLEISAFGDILYIYDGVKNSIQSIASSNLNNAGLMSSTTSNPWRIGTVHVKSNHTVHDFITTSSLRNNLFQEHLAEWKYLNIAPIANRITDALSLGVFHLKDLKFGYTLIFHDGSSITVQPDLNALTLLMAEGTAKDVDNNTIPTSTSAVIGSYGFNSYENYSSMRNYLTHFYGATGLYDQVCTTYVMTCYFVNTTLTCTVPKCQY